MISNGLIGHATILRFLEKWVENPAHGYLFHGLHHLGKRTIAERFVASLLGLEHMNFAHPDLIFLQPEEGKVQIASKAVREARARCSSRPMVATRQVVYIPHADRLNPEGTNALLKVLEESPAGVVFVFVTEDVSRLPETLLSRLVPIPFQTVRAEEIKEGLLRQGLAVEQAQLLAEKSGGRPGLAVSPQEKEGDSAERFLRATSFGERLAIIEDVTRSCDESEDSVSAWISICDAWMQEFRKALVTDDQRSARKTLHAAKGLCGARRSVGSSVSPRLALEQAALQLDLL